jgi:hypothetical protein
VYTKADVSNCKTSKALESIEQNVVEEFTRPLTAAEYFHVQTGFA